MELFFKQQCELLQFHSYRKACGYGDETEGNQDNSFKAQAAKKTSVQCAQRTVCRGRVVLHLFCLYLQLPKCFYGYVDSKASRFPRVDPIFFLGFKSIFSPYSFRF